MKFLIAVCSVWASMAFAAAQNEAEYQCGPYTLDLKGPDQTQLFDSQGNLLGEWDKEGTEPTFMQGNKFYLLWNNQQMECHLVDGSN